VTSYLDIEDALQVVDRYGFHIRDVGLLASALARPATTVVGAEAYGDLATKAAALLESVARFHPLIDDNKRHSLDADGVAVVDQRIPPRLRDR
jgi:death-on-curing protein